MRCAFHVQCIDLMLSEVAQLQVLAFHALTRQQWQIADQCLDQGRLARAVGAEQTDTVPGLQ